MLIMILYTNMKVNMVKVFFTFLHSPFLNSCEKCQTGHLLHLKKTNSNPSTKENNQNCKQSYHLNSDLFFIYHHRKLFISKNLKKQNIISISF